MTTADVSAARVLLLVPARTYRATDFLVAANRLGLDLVVGSDGALPLGGRPVIPVNPNDFQKISIGWSSGADRSMRSSPWTLRCWSWRRLWPRAGDFPTTRWMP